MNVETISTASTKQVWLRVDVDGNTIDEENIRSLSGSDDMGSTGIAPSNFTVASGEHEIVIYIRRTGPGIVGVTNMDAVLIELESATDGYAVRSSSWNVDYSFADTSFADAYEFTINKTVESPTYLIGKYTITGTTSGTSSYAYKNKDSDEYSQYWERYLSGSSDTGSAGATWLDVGETTGTKNYSILSKTTGGTVTISGKIFNMDLNDSEGHSIPHFNTTNPNTNLSNTVNYGAGEHNIANATVTNEIGDSYFISAFVSIQSTTGPQEPHIKINVSGIDQENCSSVKYRYLSGNSDVGQIYIYSVCEGLVADGIYNMSLFLTVPAGETITLIDESLSGFEVTAFDIIKGDVPPIPGEITNPTENELVGGLGKTINWSAFQDLNGDWDGTYNVTLNNRATNATVASLGNTTDLNLSIDWSSLPGEIRGPYLLFVSATDNTGLTGNTSINITIDSEPETNETTLLYGDQTTITIITATDTLTCSARFFDNYTATADYVEFNFLVNGSVNIGSFKTYSVANNTVAYSNTTITADWINKSDNWECRSRAYDGLTPISAYISSGNETVNNTAPVITIAINNSAPQDTDILSCSNTTYTDADNDTRGTTYWRWFLNSTEISGQTAQTLDLAAIGANNSDIIICEATTEDSGYQAFNSTTVNSSSVTVGSADVFTLITYDEVTYSRIYFDVTMANSTNSTSGTYQFTYNPAISTIPSGANVEVTVTNSSDYYQRTYFASISNTSNNLTAYLLPKTANAKTVNFYIQTIQGSGISNASVTVSKSINNTWVTMGEVLSDSAGVAGFTLNSDTRYRIVVFKTGYQQFTTYLTPTETTYTITLLTTSGASTFVSTLYDISWEFQPHNEIAANINTSYNFTTRSSNETIGYTAWKIYNHSTLLKEENATGANGTTLTFNFLPGPDANITAHLYIFNNKTSSLASWIRVVNTFWPVTTIAGANISNNTLSNTFRAIQQESTDGTGFGVFFIGMFTIIVCVVSSGWFAQFGYGAGILGFLVPMAMMFYIGIGFFASSFIILASVMSITAYELWRSGG